MNWIPNWSYERYYLDSNGDLLNDFEIEAHIWQSPGGADGSISISSLNHSSFICGGRLDTAYDSDYNVWHNTKIAKELQFDDTINFVAASWDSLKLYLTRKERVGSFYHLVVDWANANDEYIGIKYQTISDTIYGWIRVNCPTFTDCYIKDYATSFIKSIVEPYSFFVFPNPAFTNIYIKQNIEKDIELQIFDVVGKLITPNIRARMKETQIDVSGISEGTYFLRLSTDQGTVTKKIVVFR